MRSPSLIATFAATRSTRRFPHDPFLRRWTSDSSHSKVLLLCEDTGVVVEGNQLWVLGQSGAGIQQGSTVAWVTTGAHDWPPHLQGQAMLRHHRTQAQKTTGTQTKPFPDSPHRGIPHDRRPYRLHAGAWSSRWRTLSIGSGKIVKWTWPSSSTATTRITAIA